MSVESQNRAKYVFSVKIDDFIVYDSRYVYDINNKIVCGIEYARAMDKYRNHIRSIRVKSL